MAQTASKHTHRNKTKSLPCEAHSVLLLPLSMTDTCHWSWAMAQQPSAFTVFRALLTHCLRAHPYAHPLVLLLKVIEGQ